MAPTKPLRFDRRGSPVLGCDELFAETVRLAEAAQDYALRAAHRRMVGGGDPIACLAAAGELSRVATRLGFCLAWLLARRAVHEGELGMEEARDERWRLGGHEVCEAPIVLPERQPAELIHLSRQTADLYSRVARLDRLLDGGG